MKTCIAGTILLLMFFCIPTCLCLNAYLEVTPDRIPPDGVVTVYVENKYETGAITIDHIEVEHYESGLAYLKTVSITLNPGESLTEHFGTGESGWTPTADSSQEGRYVVEVRGPFTVKDYFNVSDMFAVPEFGLSSLLVISLTLALLLSLKRRVK